MRFADVVGPSLHSLIKNRVEIDFDGISVREMNLVSVEGLHALDAATGLPMMASSGVPPIEWNWENRRHDIYCFTDRYSVFDDFPQDQSAAMEICVKVFINRPPPPERGLPEHQHQYADLLEKENVKKEQAEVAERLLRRAKHLLKEKTPFETFANVHFLVLVPTFNSLLEQTQNRVQDEVSGYDFDGLKEALKNVDKEDQKRVRALKNLLSENINAKVFSYSSHNQKRFDKFRQACMDKKNELFVIVADECHWGVNQGGAHHSFLNDTTLLSQDNFLALLVSATPYNVLTKNSRIPEVKVKIDDESGEIRPGEGSGGDGEEELHVVSWFQKGKRGNSPYRGLEWYLSTLPSDVRMDGRQASEVARPLGRIRTDPNIFKAKISECVLMADYAFSMLFFKIYRRNKEKEYVFNHPLRALQDRDMDLAKAEDFVKQLVGLPKKVRDAVFVGVATRGIKFDPEEIEKSLRDALKKRFNVHIASRPATNVWDNSACTSSDISAQAGHWLEALKQHREEKKPIWPRDRDGGGPPGLGCETDAIIADLLDKETRPHGLGSMKIIRVSGASEEVLTTKILRYLRQDLLGDDIYVQDSQNGFRFPPFAILEDFGVEKTSSCLKLDNSFKNFKLEKPGEKDQSIQKGEKKLSAKCKKLGYENLNGLPCILVLVEKGRMGDTFPVSMDCLDLRIRASENTSTFVQEIGRLCRYPKTEPCRYQGKMITAVPPSVYPIKGDGELDQKQLVFTFEFQEGVTVFHQGDVKKNRDDVMNLMTPGRGKGRGDSVAVMSGLLEKLPIEELEFVGYADHWEEWEEGKAVPAVICSGKGAMMTGFPKKLSLSGGWKGNAPLKNDLLAFEKDGGMHYMKIEAVEDSTIHLDRDIPETAELSFVVLRDSSSLQALCRMCEGADGGSVHRVQDRMPYALVPREIMRKIEQGVSRYDEKLVHSDVRDLDILSRIKFGRLDLYVALGKGKDVSYHTYRKHSPTKTSYDSEIGAEEKHKNRLVLFAECQIGKTGAYCRFLTILKREILGNNVAHDSEQALLEVEVGGLTKPLPKLLEWALPYWEKIQKDYKKWGAGTVPQADRGKYHPKMRFLRFSILLRACNNSDWWSKFKELVREQGLAESQARFQALETFAAKNHTASCDRPLRIVGEENGFTRFTAINRDLIAKVIDWDIPTKDGEDYSKKYSIWHSSGEADKILFANRIWLDDEENGNENTYKMAGNPDATFKEVQKACWSRFGAENVSNRDDEGEAGPSDRISVQPDATLVATMNPSVRSKDGSLYSLCTDRMKEVFVTDDDSSDPVMLWIPRRFRDFFRTEGNKVIGTECENVLWSFTPSYGRHGAGSQRAGLLNRDKVCELQPRNGTPGQGWTPVELVQVLVVRKHHDEGDQEFSQYKQMWGSDYVIIQMPDTIKNPLAEGRRTAKVEDGIGYTRLAIQLIAHSLGIKRVWMLDDNIQYCMKLDLKKVREGMWKKQGEDASEIDKKILKDSVSTCSFLDVMVSIEQQVLGVESDKTFPVSPEQSWSLAGMEPRRFTKCQMSDDHKKAYAEQGDGSPIECRVDFSGALPKRFAVVGMNRDQRNVYKMNSTFNVTHSVYSFYLLNVEETVRNRAFYPSINAWEDIEFNQICREKGLMVLKCGTFFHRKENLQPRSGEQDPGVQDATPRLEMKLLIEDLSKAVDGVLKRGDEWDKSTQGPKTYLELLSVWMKGRNIKEENVFVLPADAHLDELEDCSDSDVDVLWKSEPMCGKQPWNRILKAGEPLAFCCHKKFDQHSLDDKVEGIVEHVFDFLGGRNFAFIYKTSAGSSSQVESCRSETYIVVPTRLFRSPEEDRKDSDPISCLREQWIKRLKRIDDDRFKVTCEIFAPLKGTERKLVINPTSDDEKQQDPSMLVVHIVIEPVSDVERTLSVSHETTQEKSPGMTPPRPGGKQGSVSPVQSSQSSHASTSKQIQSGQPGAGGESKKRKPKSDGDSGPPKKTKKQLVRPAAAVSAKKPPADESSSDDENSDSDYDKPLTRPAAVSAKKQLMQLLVFMERSRIGKGKSGVFFKYKQAFVEADLEWTDDKEEQLQILWRKTAYPWTTTESVNDFLCDARESVEPGGLKGAGATRNIYFYTKSKKTMHIENAFKALENSRGATAGGSGNAGAAGGAAPSQASGASTAAPGGAAMKITPEDVRSAIKKDPGMTRNKLVKVLRAEYQAADVAEIIRVISEASASTQRKVAEGPHKDETIIAARFPADAEDSGDGRLTIKVPDGAGPGDALRLW